MDVATRFQPRPRTGSSYLERERNASGSNGPAEGSGSESESLIRRKFQRTTAADADTTDHTFRKPALPASATRPPADHKPSFSHRRRSTLRENVRVPSGPREFPSPGKRVPSGSISSTTPSVSEATNSSRSFLPQSTSEPFIKPGGLPRFGFNDDNLDTIDTPATPADPAGNDFDFIPTVNFDDLQNSIANYDGNGPLLSDFPAAGGSRTTHQEMSSSGSSTSKRAGLEGSKPQASRLGEEAAVSRTSSLRRRLSAVTGGNKQASHQERPRDASGSSQPGGLSLRSRRQSTAPTGPPPSGPAPPPVGAGTRPPRKSLGPGVISSMMEGRKASQPLPSAATDPNLKSSLARTSSLSKSRRTTMQPPASGGAELPRVSTLQATTQSRANKVKSLQPPPREPADPNTPPVRPVSKGNLARAHTPSSSGNKRQSTASGRASGLGARTISPTDARRLKRLSMMQAPPLPSNPPKEHPPPPPPEEFGAAKLEFPRLAQSSPSLIPRKTSVATPTSARASPEARFGFSQGGGGVSLSSKSSYQSLNNSSGSASRLPTPKPRNVHSSSAQYGDEEEAVPPVPAIPKAYESPRECELPFFTNALRTSQSGSNFGSSERMAGEPESDMPLLSRPQQSERRSKHSVDLSRVHHRINTMENIERSMNAAEAAKPARPQQLDATGRKNSNLQPLRLPPLNLMPLHSSSNSKSGFSRPSQDLVRDDDFASFAGIAQTPEPKRIAKTPSTPMTASKATFTRRQDEEMAKQKAMRSSSSHYALRGLMQYDDNATQFFDDTDNEFTGSGVPIPVPKQRNAITPFSSGSLPKQSGEYVRAARARPSGDYTGEFTLGKFQNHQLQDSLPLKPQGPRPSRSGTDASYKTAETPSSFESPMAEAAETKKENGGGLRRKLSRGWRRSSSKATNILEHKSSPQQDNSGGSASEKEKSAPNKLHKRQSEMPPPRLPASATWTGDIPTLPVATARPSLDSMRRKSTTASVNTLTSNAVPTDTEHAPSAPPAPPVAKTKSSLHSEQPQPVNLSNRASSWGNINPTTRPGVPKAAVTNPKARQGSIATSISAIVKDKDDLTADEEMRRLSQKRRDVDSTARETEELKKRALARSPLTPDRVLHDRNCTLNIFERGEIMDYEKDGIYFTGTKNARKIVGSLTPSPQPTSSDKDSKSGNYGYDDERGDYNIVLGDHLAYRYEVVDILGKGSFGQVVRCIDHKAGGLVAVKIIRNKKRFHQQALVEVGILGRLRDWDPDGAHATLSITSSFYFRSHLCIVTPCLSINLYELIRAHNFVGFPLPLIRRFARQLLACLILLQQKRIIHCDLKPENILLCEARKADVRVIDFGSSCKEEEKVYTYIQSRFYRSPEVILGSSYGLGIDMWSLGCILAELWTGYPLFPGENEQEQLACIMEIFGPPDRHLVERCTRKKLFFDSVGKPRVTVSSKGRRRRPSSKTLSQALKTDDEAFLDFLARCLRWDPDRRMKPHDAINHPFITNQPLQQRPGIPDEARRPARVRPTAAVPNTNGSVPSPVKRVATTAGTSSSSANAFAMQQQQATPAKERSRPLPETPQTALRNGTASNSNQTQGSPSKQLGGVRRHSTVNSANSAAVAGSKRTSNGVPLSVGAASNTAAQRQASTTTNNSGNLAQMAAREANATARWRA
ncbi:DYRK-family kinase pom1 [Pseudocercospora fuligena]|uniref:DYRK-family kinase pom1 n=1 Tax=Pseudocercospora fuligena TaxID=685502 RepID=A0A8H6RQB0_9PEZI|nr:DYRK-family kinase pom1 [Pseudocercospora fuligena]